MALKPAHRHGHVIAHDLCRHHRQRLALGGVDLAGHDRAARLVFGQAQFAKAAARAGAEQPQVVRSEEHTSELQSLMRISYAVFCLKKKKNKKKNQKTIKTTIKK